MYPERGLLRGSDIDKRLPTALRTASAYVATLHYV